jgi:hypothetical protein
MMTTSALLLSSSRPLPYPSSYSSSFSSFLVSYHFLFSLSSLKSSLNFQLWESKGLIQTLRKCLPTSVPSIFIKFISALLCVGGVFRERRFQCFYFAFPPITYFPPNFLPLFSFYLGWEWLYSLGFSFCQW